MSNFVWMVDEVGLLQWLKRQNVRSQ